MLLHLPLQRLDLQAESMQILGTYIIRRGDSEAVEGLYLYYRLIILFFLSDNTAVKVIPLLLAGSGL